MGAVPARRSIGRPLRRVHGSVWALALIGAAMISCTPPDVPSRTWTRIPDAALTYLRPDTVRDIGLHPGVRYRYLWSPRGPWAVHAVQVALGDRCDVGLDVLQAEAREAGGRGRERVSEMVERAGGRILAAVNADFFTAEGAAVGTEVVDGVVTSAAARPTLAWRRGSEPWIGVTGLDGETLVLGWSVEAPGTEAVGGFPDLLDDGRRVGDLEVDARPSFAAARHPRTAVGYDIDGRELWLVVVDGRQAPHSTGMSLPELADLFEALGVEEALNLDGGGSTTLVVGASPVNRPSDATGERPVVNALALVRSPEACGASSGSSGR